MNQGIDVQLRQIFASMQAQVIGALPRIIAALILIAIAFIVAAVVERLLRVALRRIRFDALLRRTGVDQWLQRVGLRQPMNDFLPRVSYFLLLFVFARSAADLLGLAAISAAIGAALVLLPRILVALAILLIGGALAAFVGAAVREFAQNLGVDFAAALGSAVSLVTMVVLVMMSLDQVGIDTAFVRLVVGIAFAGGALAAALSLGLGTRDVSRNIIAGFYARRTFTIGEPMEIRGEAGTLLAFTPTQVLLQQGERVVAVPNQSFLDGVVRQ